MSTTHYSSTQKKITGAIDLTFRRRNALTLVDQQVCSGLLRASRPVYRRTQTIPEVQLIHLGPGCMNGDHYEQHLQVGDLACAVVGFQSYTKVLPGSIGSTLHTTVALGCHAQLEIKPNIVIPFKDSNYTSTTSVYLSSGGSTLMMSDILVSGTDSDSEKLCCNGVAMTLHVYRDDELVLRDCLQVGMRSLGRGRMWAKGYPILGTIYLLGEVSPDREQNLVGVAQTLMTPELRIGVTGIVKVGYVLRILAQRVREVERVIDSVNRIRSEWSF